MLVMVDQDAVALSSGDVSAIGEIRRPSISLAVWWREPPLALTVEDAQSFEPIRFASATETVCEALHAALAATGQAQWHQPLAEDAGRLAALFAGVMQTDRVDVRLEPVSTNACWKLHADYVVARLITTYVGPGTQWVRADDPEPRQIHQLRPGDVGVFKGRLADPDARVLHRSPPVGDTGDHRIMLVIDPAGSSQ